MNYLSTGRAAKMLSVTPDTILKWIKQGRICALRTPGGHYRVPEDQIKTIIDQIGQTEPPSITAFIEEYTPYCWEFFSDQDSPGHGCRDCLVYQARALKCYKMSHLCQQAGQKGEGQEGSCDGCAYFQTQMQR